MDTIEGTFAGVEYTPGSGGAFLLVAAPEDGEITRHFADAGPLFRALRQARLELGEQIVVYPGDWAIEGFSRPGGDL